ncbi:MAG TPA: 30S ribosomal protein S6 [Candidatus Paceibacterota bacterium]|jgi:ribosomal protein S6|nr:30S ribosomal protein S6 [Candidatus Paceibacterota bacterium]
MSDEAVKAENNIVEEESSSNEARIYEVGYLLVPDISEEDLPAAYGNLKEMVSSAGGRIIADDAPKMIPLAYSMEKVWKNKKSKFSSAYFGWVKFETDPEKVADLKKKLELDPNIIRFIMIKTVRENTIAAKRFTHREGMRRRPAAPRHEDHEPAGEINKEEIDKEIEALVA